jgi:hypothetical protein
MLLHHVDVLHHAAAIWQGEPLIAIPARLNDAIFPQWLRRTQFASAAESLTVKFAVRATVITEPITALHLAGEGRRRLAALSHTARWTRIAVDPDPVPVHRAVTAGFAEVPAAEDDAWSLVR